MSANLPKVRGDSLIVRAESLAAWRDGVNFLEQAKKDAQALQSDALAQAQALREQSRQDGYADGRRAAMEEAAELALKLAAERDAYLAELEPRMVRVIDTAFRKILDGMPDHDLVMLAVRKAIGELRESGRLTLRVAPGILSGEIVQNLACSVAVSEDDTLRDSQCFLETPVGMIELTPHAQWERILNALQRDGKEDE